MATPEEMQAEVDRLKQELTDKKAQVSEAAKIQKAFINLPLKERKYLDALAKGETPEPLVQSSTPEPTPAIDPDLDIQGALAQQKAELMEAFSTQLNQALALRDQQLEHVASEARTLRSEKTISQAQRDFDAKYGDGMFEKHREAAAAQDPNDPSVLLKAAALDELLESAKQSAAKTGLQQRNVLLDGLGFGPSPGGARGGDETSFDDLDWDNDIEGSLAAAAQRMAEGG